MKAPLFEAIRKYIGEDILPFHMPGHKMGKGFEKLNSINIDFEEFKNDIFKFDLTEVEGTDNLHYPEEAIMEAQIEAAKAFGSEKTYFLVNGSTCGIYAMILSVCNPGDKLIVARDCHKAVTGALMLGDIEPVYIMPEIVKEFNIGGGIGALGLEKLIQSNLDAKAVLITSPSFYGINSDLKKISEITHKYNMKLLVDEAHGAHFCFSDMLPMSALSAGADICIQSAHKTLSALTQSSYLHISDKFKDIQRLEAMLRLVQTTSPSYLLMTALDMARYQMQKNGKNELERVIHICREVRKNLEVINVKCVDKNLNGKYAINDVDETRMALNFINYEISGYNMEKKLRNIYKIQLEMADIYNIVAICTISDSDKDILRLGKAVEMLLKSNNNDKRLPTDVLNVYDGMYKFIPKLIMKPRETMYLNSEWVSVGSSLGRISKEIIAPYPPGIPLVAPGEIIDKENIDIISKVLAYGGHVNGVYNGKVLVLTDF
jgi:lysine decarboxylase